MTVAPATLVALIIGTLIVALLPIGLYRFLKSPQSLDRRDAIVGIAAFMLFATLLERGFYALLPTLLPESSGLAGLLAHPGAVVAFSTLIAAVFEEAGRYLGLRFAAHRFGAAPGDGRGLGLGIGFGGAQAWYVGVIVLGQWTWLVWLASRNQLDAQLSSMPPDLALRIQMMLVTMSGWSVALRALECVAGFTFQLALTVLVWRGVRARRWWILPLAIVLHLIGDLPMIAFNFGAIGSWALVALTALLIVIPALLLVQASRRATRAL